MRPRASCRRTSTSCAAMLTAISSTVTAGNDDHKGVGVDRRIRQCLCDIADHRRDGRLQPT